MEHDAAALECLFTAIIEQSTPESVAIRRQIVRRSLQRIRAGTAEGEETEILRTALQGMLNRPGGAEEKRHLAALTLYYLSPEPMTARELGRRLNVDLRTVHRDISRAVEQMTVAIYGIDGVVFQK